MLHGVHAGNCTTCNLALDPLLHIVQLLDMTNLSEYLTRAGLNQRRFAEAVGVDPSIISRLVAGKMTPSLTLAVNIETATCGEVLAREWVKRPKKRAKTMHNMQESVCRTASIQEAPSKKVTVS